MAATRRGLRCLSTGRQACSSVCAVAGRRAGRRAWPPPGRGLRCPQYRPSMFICWYEGGTPRMAATRRGLWCLNTGQACSSVCAAAGTRVGRRAWPPPGGGCGRRSTGHQACSSVCAAAAGRRAVGRAGPPPGRGLRRLSTGHQACSSVCAAAGRRAGRRAWPPPGRGLRCLSTGHQACSSVCAAAAGRAVRRAWPPPDASVPAQHVHLYVLLLVGRYAAHCRHQAGVADTHRPSVAQVLALKVVFNVEITTLEQKNQEVLNKQK
jgi:hypothetical protein